MEPITFTFGELEARLAHEHSIAESKRTAFQARLKNFHRLGFPATLETSKGKTARYSPGQVVEMALAVQLTELGLNPERVVAILRSSIIPVGLALKHSSAVLYDQTRTTPAGMPVYVPLTDAILTYLTLDPAALWSLTDHGEAALETWDMARLTLFCLRGTAVKRDLVHLTAYSSRISLLNVTSSVARLARPPKTLGRKEGLQWSTQFLSQIRDYAAERLDLKSDDVAQLMVGRFLQMKGAQWQELRDPSLARQTAEDMYLPIETVRKGIMRLRERENG